MPLDLGRVRRQLRLDPDYTDEDQDLLDLVEEAKTAIGRECDGAVIDAGPAGPRDIVMAPDIERAVLMMVTYWHENRDGGREMPDGVLRLIRPHRNY